MIGRSSTRESLRVSRRSRLLIPIGAVAVIALVAIATLQMRNRDYALPVTATDAWDTSLSWSADGRFIAFTRMAQGNLDIHIKPIDGGEAVARIQGPGDQVAPRWSPDGRHLAYLSTEEPGSPVFLVPSEPGGLPTASGRPEYVVPTEGAWHVHNGGWSPDSKKLVYTHDQDYGDIYKLVERR